MGLRSNKTSGKGKAGQAMTKAFLNNSNPGVAADVLLLE
jgi:hypothetical protein